MASSRPRQAETLKTAKDSGHRHTGLTCVNKNAARLSRVPHRPVSLFLLQLALSFLGD